MPSLLNRSSVDRCRDAVARLTARLEQNKATVARARRAHGEAGADASDEAAAAKAAARTKAALQRAEDDLRDTETFLAIARERLAAAERRAEADRIAEGWRKTEALCARRNNLAKRIEEQAAALFATYGELVATDAELPGAIPVAFGRYGINAGPAGHLGHAALSGMFTACLNRIGRPHHLALGGTHSTAGSPTAPSFAARVAAASAAILALRERTAGVADATDAGADTGEQAA
jgi:hypothetical protein